MQDNQSNPHRQPTAATPKIRTLFISPTPALSPLLHSQGIPHMCELSKRGYEFTLLSTEEKNWNDEQQRRAEQVRKTLGDHGIEWVPLHFKKFPGLNANISDAVRIMLVALRLIRRKKIQVVHCRSYMPAFATLVIRKFCKVKFIFDTRGFYPDEKVGTGYWTPDSFFYRLSKRLEDKCFRAADSIVVTNDGMRLTILDQYPNPTDREAIDRKLSVIWNCVNTERFRPDPVARAEMRKQYGLENRTVIFWALTSIWPCHMPAESIAFVRACKERFGNVTLMMATHDPKAEEMMKTNGLVEGDYMIRSVPPAEMPRFATMADVGISFGDPAYHASFIKLAEYLSVGFPAAVNRGQTPFDDMVGSAKAGVVIESCTPEGYTQAAQDLADMLKDRDSLVIRCRDLAERELSLRSAVDKYEKVYHSILG